MQLLIGLLLALLGAIILLADTQYVKRHGLDAINEKLKFKEYMGIRENQIATVATVWLLVGFGLMMVGIGLAYFSFGGVRHVFYLATSLMN